MRRASSLAAVRRAAANAQSSSRGVGEERLFDKARQQDENLEAILVCVERRKVELLQSAGKRMSHGKEMIIVIDFSQSEVGRKKPRGVIELDYFSRISRSAQTHTFEV